MPVEISTSFCLFDWEHLLLSELFKDCFSNWNAPQIDIVSLGFLSKISVCLKMFTASRTIVLRHKISSWHTQFFET